MAEPAEDGMLVPACTSKPSLSASSCAGEALKNALWYKSVGNRRLSEGDGKAAAQEYTNGLEWLEDVSVSADAVREVRVALLSNRSQAMLQQKRWSEALADAEAVLVEDCRHHKARFRKAKALVELRHFYEAVAVLELLAAEEPDNEHVRSLILRTEELAAKGGPAAEQETDVLARKGKKKDQEQTWESETDRLIETSEHLCNAGSFEDALKRANNAVALLEAHTQQAMNVPQDFKPVVRSMFAPKRPSAPVTGAREATDLIAAYAQRCKCLLALRDFGLARETASRALKLYDWQAQRLSINFNDPGGLQSSATIVELLGSVSLAGTALSAALAELAADRPAEAQALTFKALEGFESRRDWPAAAPLRAELYAVRAEAALRGGDTARGHSDAEIALNVDSACARARAIVRREGTG